MAVSQCVALPHERSLLTPADISHSCFFLLNLVDQCQIVSMYITYKHTPDFALSALGNGICHSRIIRVWHIPLPSAEIGGTPLLHIFGLIELTRTRFDIEQSNSAT